MLFVCCFMYYDSIVFQTLMKHFKTIPVKEKDIVTYFIYTVKTNSNKLDQKNGLNNDTA